MNTIEQYYTKVTLLFILLLQFKTIIGHKEDYYWGQKNKVYLREG
jgi:hypothetical protein